MTKKILFSTVFVLLLSITFQACNSDSTSDEKLDFADNKKVGVLLVNHGSRSETWRNALLQLEQNVRDSLLEDGSVKGVKTAFMEYTEPSIATRLKEFDKDGFTDIVIIPIFLTVSPHSFEDIPTIVGQKEDPNAMEMLKIEKIERYTPTAKTYITPLLDFTDILQKNILKRTEELSQDPDNEGLVLIGYGDETYDKEWGELFDNVAEYVKQNTGINEHTYGWCGHIAHYKQSETTKPINAVLEKKNKAIVIPVLVAHDEYFQIEVIGGGVANVENYGERVIYKPDAILPDKNIEAWVINVAEEYVGDVLSESIE